MEITLHDGTKVSFTWTKSRMLNIEIWWRQAVRDPDTWALVGSRLLAGEELRDFLRALQPPVPRIAA